MGGGLYPVGSGVDSNIERWIPARLAAAAGLNTASGDDDFWLTNGAHARSFVRMAGGGQQLAPHKGMANAST